MKKIDTWLDIQKYVQDAAHAPVAPQVLADIEFLARIDPIRKKIKRNWFTRRRLR